MVGKMDSGCWWPSVAAFLAKTPGRQGCAEEWAAGHTAGTSSQLGCQAISCLPHSRKQRCVLFYFFQRGP